MKTLKTIILGFIAVMTFGAASAKTTTTTNDKFSIKYALSAYVDAITVGKNEALVEVLDQDFKFTMLRGSAMFSCNKNQMLTFMKTTENVKQDCQTSVTISESNADITVAKVTMKYPGFTRTNYVTLASTTEGWKITSVYSVFKS
jgi:hypothetical protein